MAHFGMPSRFALLMGCYQAKPISDFQVLKDLPLQTDVTHPHAVDQPNLISRTVRTLRGLADQLERGALIEPIEWTIPMQDVGTDCMIEHCDAISAALGKKHLAIYAICVDDNVPLDRIYEVVDSNKDHNKLLPPDRRRAFARVNKRKGCLGSRCLYVGKSEKAAARIRQHLIEGPQATFAIHMKYWPNDIPGNLIVRVVGVSNVPSVLVPFIEDQLASETPPILGRRGSV